MPAIIDCEEADFADNLERLLQQNRNPQHDLSEIVQKIISQVRADGDDALRKLTQKFDQFDPQPIQMTKKAIEETVTGVDRKDRRALEIAADRIRKFHEQELPQDKSWTDSSGVFLGWRWRSVDAAGLYAPGGIASYPSTVLMNAIPAQIAGVKRLALCMPTPGGKANPLTILAAQLVGIEEIYPIGGAQAIAALAYGTNSIKPVDIITGPGNAYVAEAKRAVFGHVGIDTIAGPSEVLIIAEKGANPHWVAIDLLSQAEHDTQAQAILITDDKALARNVELAVDKILATLPRSQIASASWREYGAIIRINDLSQSISIVDRFAPEHVQIITKDPENIAQQVNHAGAIFLGAYTPEAMGDYIAGPNHILPTARSARFSSGLSVLNFLKRSTILQMNRGAMEQLAPHASRLAQAEGLDAHAMSASARIGNSTFERLD